VRRAGNRGTVMSPKSGGRDRCLTQHSAWVFSDGDGNSLCTRGHGQFAVDQDANLAPNAEEQARALAATTRFRCTVVYGDAASD